MDMDLSGLDELDVVEGLEFLDPLLSGEPPLLRQTLCSGGHLSTLSSPASA
jgi:hypothetical protein